jgi:hypothetical protein
LHAAAAKAHGLRELRGQFRALNPQPLQVQPALGFRRQRRQEGGELFESNDIHAR